MNIHPIFVHFPIALLTLYALSELLYVKKVRELSYLFYTKAIVVILGTLSAFVTLQTGEWAADSFQSASARHIIETHSNWADATVAIFFCVGRFVPHSLGWKICSGAQLVGITPRASHTMARTIGYSALVCVDSLGTTDRACRPYRHHCHRCARRLARIRTRGGPGG